MKATSNDIKNLKKIQEVDAQIKNVHAAVRDLPEIKEYRLVDEKLKDIKSKIKQVEVMKRNVERRYEKMNAEDLSLADRQKTVQRSIDDAAGDYRNLEVHTKELDSISSRRNVLAEIMINATVEQEKVEELQSKLKAAQETVCEKKNSLGKQIDAAKAKAREEIVGLTVSRKKVYDSLPKGIAALYDDAAVKVGNVVLSELDGNCCSVCRSPIEEGKLLEIKKAGEISVCPACGRIIITDGE